MIISDWVGTYWPTTFVFISKLQHFRDLGNFQHFASQLENQGTPAYGHSANIFKCKCLFQNVHYRITFPKMFAKFNISLTFAWPGKRDFKTFKISNIANTNISQLNYLNYDNLILGESHALFTWEWCIYVLVRFRSSVTVLFRISSVGLHHNFWRSSSNT